MGSVYSTQLTGVVATNLEKTPVSISSSETSIELATGNPSYDIFELFAPVSVIGMQINILANIQMPPGTMANAHPSFVSVAIGAPDTVIYSDASTGTSTTLGIASGTLITTIPAGTYNSEPPAGVQPYVEGAQAITGHADGTESAQSIGTVPIDLGAPSDRVALRSMPQVYPMGETAERRSQDRMCRSCMPGQQNISPVRIRLA